MTINTLSPVFRFASLRDPKPRKKIAVLTDIFLETAFVKSLIDNNESSATDAQKIIKANSILQEFVSGPTFFKTEQDFYSSIKIASPSQEAISLMYDNVVARLLTKSNTNQVYGLVVKYIKEFAAALNSTKEENVRIILPERLTFAFTEFEGNNEPGTVEDNEALQNRMNALLLAQNKLAEAKAEDIISFTNGKQVVKRITDYSQLLQSFGTNQLSVAEAETQLRTRLADIDKKLKASQTFPQTDESLAGKTTFRTTETANTTSANNDYQSVSLLLALVQKAKDKGLTLLRDTQTIDTTTYSSVLTALNEKGPITIENAENRISSEISNTFSQLKKVLPGTTYSLIGGSWKAVSGAGANEPLIPETSGTNIFVYTHGCYLKYPVQVADLRIVEQQTVGYLPAEIAHINNTQKGETNTRVTRRLRTVETFESLINESEVTHETDSQSTEKFGMESSAYDVQQEENSFNINGSVSYTMGPWSATVSGGYSSSSLELSGNTSAQSYAKEVFTRIVDRTSNRIRVERSVKTLEEFEETVTHVIDNSTQETKSYIYRWLNKLVRGTLKNYGKRLIFQFDIAHPAHYYLSRSIKEKSVLNIPDDPRTFTLGGAPFSPQMINESNYISWGNLYNVKLEAPPKKNIIISEVFSGNSNPTWEKKLLSIKAGYQCKWADVTNMYLNGWPGGNAIAIMVGKASHAHWSGGDDFWTPVTFWLNNETENLPVNIFSWRQGYMMNIEVLCEITPEAMLDWQQKAYYDIIEGYDKLKTAAEAKLNEFDINAPGLPPEKKLELIKTELKKETIRKMYRCNPFWVNDRYEVGKEYDPNCCLDSQNAERVRFIESIFDWRNMTYELHPYFYNNKNNWAKLLDLSDDYPHFEAFLRSSYATVKVPVFRENLKEIAACNFIVNNAIGNYETIPEGLEGLLQELSTEPASLFTYDLDGNPLPVPKSTVDLGIFNLPTSLVILECSNQDGVKPIGFPQTAPDTTDVSIPKQYSPAIIADNCNP